MIELYTALCITLHVKKNTSNNVTLIFLFYLHNLTEKSIGTA